MTNKCKSCGKEMPVPGTCVTCIANHFDQVTVVLTKRELTLIRVAMMQRLDRLKGKTTADRGSSYNEVRAMLDIGGVLHEAAFPRWEGGKKVARTQETPTELHDRYKAAYPEPLKPTISDQLQHDPMPDDQDYDDNGNLKAGCGHNTTAPVGGYPQQGEP